MPIEFRCTQCGKLLRTPDEMAGKRAKCPECGTVLSVPAAGAGTPGPPPPRPPGPGSGSPFGVSPAPGYPPGSPFGRAVPPGAPGVQPNPYQSPFAAGAAGGAGGGFAPTRIDFGDIFSRTWNIFTEQWGMCVVVALVAGLMIGGVYFGVFLVVALLAAATTSPTVTVLFFSVGLIGLMVFALWIGIGQALFFLKIARGQPGELGDLFTGGPYLWPVLGAGILVGLIVMAGTMLCVIPGIIFGLMFSQALYLILDRNAGVMESLGLSRQVTGGNKLMLFAIQLVAGLLMELFIVCTCGLGALVAVPFMQLMTAVIYLAMTGQPTADRLRMGAPGPYAPPPAMPS